MLKLVTHIKETTQLKWNRVSRFRPTIPMEIEVGSYVIKTANSVEELLKIFRLRHEVFHREFRDILRPGLDIDKYDRAFDHLIIYHKPTDQIIGTYRLRSSENTVRSYTGQEFDLSELHRMGGPFLELGRACIHQEHRKGAVMSLLFRGIAEYMNRSGAETLFGCSSLKTADPRLSALVYRYFENVGAVQEGVALEPMSAFKMPKLDYWLSELDHPLTPEERTEAEAAIPSLLKAYIKMGATIACEPAFDKDFDCIDFLTLLKKEELAESLVRRFQVAR